MLQLVLLTVQVTIPGTDYPAEYSVDYSRTVTVLLTIQVAILQTVSNYLAGHAGDYRRDCD